MAVGLQLGLLLGTVWYLAYCHATVRIWTAVMALVLIVLTIFHDLPVLLLGVSWLLYLVGVFLFNANAWRMAKITRPFLIWFSKKLPKISDTEHQAIEAGDVWWEAELFRGRPDWKKLDDMPRLQLTAAEQAFLDNEVETLCQQLDEWNIVHEAYDLPPKVWAFLKEKGFLSLELPQEFGGKGFSTYAHSTIVMKIASRSMSAAISVMVPNSLGPAELVLRYGTPEQKQHYLPRLASGEEVPCFALTSPEAGSDATAMPDTGILCKGMFEGKEVLGIRLNWYKHYITLAPIATLMGLAFKLYDPDHLLGKETEIGITVCLVPTHLPGVEKGMRHLPLNLAFLNGPIRGKDVFVPLDYVIGGKEMCGKGWQMLMEALSVGRGISLPALATAAGKFSFRVSGAYARVREQFNTFIGNFEGIGHALARIGGLTYAAEATRLLTVTGIEQGFRPALATAITKYHLTEMARVIVNAAMDIHGGRAIQLGPRNYLGFLYFSLPISVTVEGANILTRNLIIFGQGAIRCHPYIRQEIEILAEPDEEKRVRAFDELLCNHIRFTAGNCAGALGYGLSAGRLIQVPQAGKVKRYYQQLTRMSTALAMTSDIVMLLLGGDLKRREAISARLGDILSELYMSSAVLKYFKDQNSPQEDLPFVQWALDQSLFHMQSTFEVLFDNFPSRWLGQFLRWVVFPWGNPYRKPRDTTTQQIVTAMLKPSAQRDRITSFCFVDKNLNDAVGRLEEAFLLANAIAPLQQKLKQMIAKGEIPQNAKIAEKLIAAQRLGIFSEEDVRLYHQYESLRLDVIQVDEFTLTAFARKTNHAKQPTIS